MGIKAGSFYAMFPAWHQEEVWNLESHWSTTIDFFTDRVFHCEYLGRFITNYVHYLSLIKISIYPWIERITWPGTHNLETGTRKLEPWNWNPEVGTRNQEIVSFSNSEVLVLRLIFGKMIAGYVKYWPNYTMYMKCMAIYLKLMMLCS